MVQAIRRMSSMAARRPQEPTPVVKTEEEAQNTVVTESTADQPKEEEKPAIGGTTQTELS